MTDSRGKVSLYRTKRIPSISCSAALLMAPSRFKKFIQPDRLPPIGSGDENPFFHVGLTFIMVLCEFTAPPNQPFEPAARISSAEITIGTQHNLHGVPLYAISVRHV